MKDDRLTNTVFEQRDIPLEAIDFVWECIQELWENANSPEELVKNATRWRIRTFTVYKEAPHLGVAVEVDCKAFTFRIRVIPVTE